MRAEFFAIQLIGVAIALTGVACLAALPLPDYRWYNRVAVIGFMGPFASLTVILRLLVPLMSGRPLDPLGFAIGSLMFGIAMLVITCLSVYTFGVLYPSTIDDTSPSKSRPLALGVKLLPVGIAVQLVPSALTLAGTLIR